MNGETRKLTTILAADVAGYSRLTGADEEGTLTRLRELRRTLIDPTIAANRGRIVKTAGDGMLLEFASVVDAVRCAITVQRDMATRNADFVSEKRIQFRVGVHLGDVVVEGDGDLMGDGVNIAARLEGICDPGRIFLSRAAKEQIEDKIGDPIIELGRRELKHIARPVEVFAIDPSLHAAAAGGSGLMKPANEPPRLSIVVLPFANIGGDPEQDYFVDGVTESLTTDLSRISGSFVIARNTAFTYKGKAVDVKQIRRELNVRYVLEGSIQRGGNRLRVNVQLIDAETGAHLWAERFDKPLADLFDMQDEIVAHLANQLDSQLVVAEAHRAEHTPNPASVDLYFQGVAWANRGWTPQHLMQARGYYERALALDAGNIDALVGTASVDTFGTGGVFLADDPTAQLATAEAALMSALSRAPGHALAHLVLGRLLIQTNRAPQGIAECLRALALDHNLARAHVTIGSAKYAIGRGEETEAHVIEALRLSPRDTFAYIWLATIGVSKQYIGADEEAVSWLRRGIEINRNYSAAHFMLAAALAQLGRQEEARAATQAGLSLDPGFTIGRYRAGAMGDNPIYLAQRERIYDGMRKAGVPD